jgi:uncharacterized membrane protein
MSRKVVWRLLGLLVGVLALAIIGVVAYKLGANASHGGAQTAFGPMRGFGRMVGFDGGFGLWGLIPLLLLGLLVVGLVAVLATPIGRPTPPSTPPMPGPGVASSGVASSGVDGLQQLTEMHTRGDLTDEEFSAAKRRLLGL